jgi:outer membrane protein OmpA-like peptidoglycan-associated protein
MKSFTLILLVAILLHTSGSGCAHSSSTLSNRAQTQPIVEPSALDKTDSTVAGAALGAAWGAGAGAIVGHQLSYAGEGTAIGAGLGAINGATTGLAHDAAQERLFAQEQVLSQLQMESQQNSQLLAEVQSKLDTPSHSDSSSTIYNIYTILFDQLATSPRLGSIRILEIIANSLRKDPYIKEILVEGHSDDEGTPEQTLQIAESRARSVSTFLTTQGLPLNKFVIKSYGSTHPIASNETAEGRQLNRRVEIIIVRK